MAALLKDVLQLVISRRNITRFARGCDRFTATSFARTITISLQVLSLKRLSTFSPISVSFAGVSQPVRRELLEDGPAAVGVGRPGTSDFSLSVVSGASPRRLLRVFVRVFVLVRVLARMLVFVCARI